MSAERPDTVADPDVTQLQTRIAELEAQLADAREHAAAPPTATAPSRRDRRQAEGRPLSRTIISAILITLACVLAPLSAVSVWARGEVTDTDRYLATVGPLASNPTIQNAVSARITDEVFQYVDITGLTKRAVGAIADQANLSPAAAAADRAGGTDRQRHQRVSPANRSPTSCGRGVRQRLGRGQQRWRARRSTTCCRVTASRHWRSRGDAVVLNLGDLTAKVKSALVAKGFTVAEKIPAVNTEVTVFQSNDIPKIQTAYSLLNTLGYWLPLIVAALAVIGVLVANNKRRAMLGFGIGLAVAMLVGGVALAIARAGYINAPPQGSTCPRRRCSSTPSSTSSSNRCGPASRPGDYRRRGGDVWSDPLRGGRSGHLRHRCGSDSASARLLGRHDDVGASVGLGAGAGAAHRGDDRRSGLHHAAALQDLAVGDLDRSGAAVVLFLIRFWPRAMTCEADEATSTKMLTSRRRPWACPRRVGRMRPPVPRRDDAVKVGASAAAPTEAGGAGAGPTGSAWSLTKAD